MNQENIQPNGDDLLELRLRHASQSCSPIVPLKVEEIQEKLSARRWKRKTIRFGMLLTAIGLGLTTLVVSRPNDFLKYQVVDSRTPHARASVFSPIETEDSLTVREQLDAISDELNDVELRVDEVVHRQVMIQLESRINEKQMEYAQLIRQNAAAKFLWKMADVR